MDHSLWKEASINDSVLMSIDKIRSMTRRNNHSEAYAAGAEALGARKLAKQFELLAQLRDLEGHMPRTLGDYQYQLYQDMMTYAKRVLDEDTYDQFYGSF